MPGPTGAARIRRSVPWRRSSNRLTSPAWAEKNRNRIAIDARSRSAGSSCAELGRDRRRAATGGGAAAAAAPGAPARSGGSEAPASDAAVVTASCDAGDAVAEPRRRRRARPPSRARWSATPTTSIVTGRPASIAAVKPCRDDERRVRRRPPPPRRGPPPRSATSITSATPAGRERPDDVLAQHHRQLAAVEVRDDPLRVERGVEPDELAEDHARARAARRSRRGSRTGRGTAGGGPWRRSGARRAAAPRQSTVSRRARPVRWRNTASRSGSHELDAAHPARPRPRPRRAAGAAARRASATRISSSSPRTPHLGRPPRRAGSPPRPRRPRRVSIEPDAVLAARSSATSSRGRALGADLARRR